MAAPIITIFSLVYFLFCCCVLYPPTEIVSAGLTIESIFSSYLNSEDILFVHYHIKRTALTLAVHSLLPLVYCIGSEWFFPDGGLISSTLQQSSGIFANTFVIFSILLPILTSFLVLYWSYGEWKRHPCCTSLTKYGRPRWQAIAAHINTEYRRIDKFSSGHGNISRVIVTDSWLIKVTPYFINVIQQSDAKLSLISSEHHDLSHTDATGSQYLTILVTSTGNKVPSFKIRLNSMEYGDLCHKIQQPIDNARNIVVQQTISERFVDAFTDVVRSNPRYVLPNDATLEACIGCMQTTSNVKLEKNCDNDRESEGRPKCVSCFCRPMWCIECMAKWFASRQEAAYPETWLSKTSPCPTCRSIFCMLDVHLVQPT